MGPDFDEVGAVHAVMRSGGPGVMVDVGAHHGGSLRRFADDGWLVYALEPDPANRTILLDRVGHIQNVSVDGRAISGEDGQSVKLYTSEISSGISTLTPFHPTHRPTVDVETVRLDTYLAQVDHVTVLKTDVEGLDLPVLRTFPWGRLRPAAVICEFEDRKTVPLGYDHRDLAEFLAQLGYAVLISEWYPVVEYGNHHHWRSLRRYPTALTDPTAWGNLIGIEDRYAANVLKQAEWRGRLTLRWRRLAAVMKR